MCCRDQMMAKHTDTKTTKKEDKQRSSAPKQGGYISKRGRTDLVYTGKKSDQLQGKRLEGDKWATHQKSKPALIAKIRQMCKEVKKNGTG